MEHNSDYKKATFSDLNKNYDLNNNVTFMSDHVVNQDQNPIEFVIYNTMHDVGVHNYPNIYAMITTIGVIYFEYDPDVDTYPYVVVHNPDHRYQRKRNEPVWRPFVQPFDDHKSYIYTSDVLNKFNKRHAVKQSAISALGRNTRIPEDIAQYEISSYLGGWRSRRRKFRRRKTRRNKHTRRRR